MAGRWSADQVLALAPDPASVSAARKLLTPGAWRETGAQDGLVWGLCAGSGNNPYQTAVDIGGPAYHCSCPSRKFPCKHSLALLLLWADGAVGDTTDPLEFARVWQAGRADRAEKSRDVEAKPKTEKDVAAAARRAEQRGERVAAGLAELELWLRDQVRAGITGAAAGYQHVEPVAGRMVDAQAPGVAGALRGLGGISGTGDGWPARLLSGYARLHLLARAHESLATLPPDLAATVRTHVGYPVAKEAVLATPAIADRWLALGRHDVLDAAVPVRRTWLRGAATCRFALLLTFDPRGSFAADPVAALVPGTAIEAGLHFYPGRPPLRALVAGNREEPAGATACRPPDPDSVDDLLAGWAAALEGDPWLLDWPTVLVGVPVARADGWWLVENDMTAVPLRVGGVDPWVLSAVAGGAPARVFGEWTGTGLRPLTVWDEQGAAVRLT